MSEDYDRPHREETTTSGKAVASLICGIASFCVPILPSIFAIVFGALSLRDIGRSHGRLGRNGLAIAGLVTGSIGLVVIGPLVLSSLLILPAIQRVHDAANRLRSANSLKQIGLALHEYHDIHGTFPPAVVYSPEGKPLYSWRVLILPFIEEDRLYRQFKLDEPWDSSNNKPLLAQMPNIYSNPYENLPTQSSATNYLVFTGGGAMFDIGPKSRPRRFADIVDGTANTIMVVEAANAVPWTKPEDLAYSPDQPLPPLGVNSSTVNILMADGAVHPIPKNADEKTLRALITCNGGEIVEVPGATPSPSPANKPARPSKGVMK
jgi:hypothetical protein